jgi:dipeptidase E
MVRPHVLLLSNSLQHGRGFLDHAEPEIRALLGPKARVAFVPYAAHDLDEYEARAKARFAQLGYALESVHRYQDREEQLLGDCSAVFIGGGNTFRLLHRLYLFDLVTRIRRRVAQGAAYLGSSAGAIVAGPSLRTTKDMPVVEPPSFAALHLVPFHISPHYLDPDPRSTHMGETQEERIFQFLQENEGRVVGLREGSWLAVRAETVALGGAAPARLFQRGRAPYECPPGPLAWDAAP